MTSLDASEPHADALAPRPLDGPRPAWELACLDRPDRPRWRARVERDRVHVAITGPTGAIRSTWDADGRLVARTTYERGAGDEALDVVPLGEHLVIAADGRALHVAEPGRALRPVPFAEPLVGPVSLVPLADGGVVVSGATSDHMAALVDVGPDGVVRSRAKRSGDAVTAIADLEGRTVRVASVDEPWRAGWDVEVERADGTRCRAGRPSLVADGVLWFDGWIVAHGGREVWGMPVTRVTPLEAVLLGPRSPLGWLSISSLSAVPGLRALRARLWSRFRQGLEGFRLLPFGTTSIGPIPGDPLRVRWTRLEDDATGTFAFARRGPAPAAPGVLLVSP